MALRKPAVTTTPDPVTTEEDTRVAAADTTVVDAAEERTEPHADVDEGLSDADEGNAGLDQEAPMNPASETEADVVQPKTKVDPTPEVKESKSTQVAEKSENTQVATAKPATGAQAFVQELASQGFEGLEIGGMSFDRVKLDDGAFLLGSDETPIGSSFVFKTHSTRSIYLVRQHDMKEPEVFYSYDPEGKLNTDGTSAQATLDGWIEDGYGPDSWVIKKYLEVQATLVDRDDEYNDMPVLLSIPPASVQRFSGIFAVGFRKYPEAGEYAPNLKLKAEVGKKIGTGEKAFRPWVFTAVGVVDGV